MKSGVGVWRSLVAHLLWEQRVVSSNLTTPTIKIKELVFPLLPYYLGLGAIWELANS